MRKNKILAASLSVALSVAMVSGCAKSSDANETTTATESTKEASTEAATEEDSTAAEETTVEKTTVEKTTEEETTAEKETKGYEYSGSDKLGDLHGLTANEIVEQMGFGYNIGNSFDATGDGSYDVLAHEMSWGNAVINQDLLDSVKAAGFDTVRIPTTWANFVDNDNDYAIDARYLARVREVVDYCYQNDMFVILNIHHEGWLNNKDLVKNQDAIAEKFEAVWTQIADYFADYDQHLIFEGMNEPRFAGTDIEWSGSEKGYETVNYLDQIFVNVVKSSGKGYNDERCLMIPGYAASNSAAIFGGINVPTYEGEAASNIIFAIHAYAPYDFCLSDSRKQFDVNSPDCTSAIDTTFDVIKTAALDYGIPVVMGETGATNKDNTEARENWAYYMGQKAAGYGVPIVLWDNGYKGNSGGECHAYFDRATGEPLYPTVIGAMMKAKEEVEWGSLVNESGSTSDAEAMLGGSIVVSYPDGHTSVDQWNASYITVPALENIFMGKKDIAIVYSSEEGGSPKMILDSEACAQWWMPVEPTSIEDMGDKKVATFSGEDIKKVMDSFGVDAYSQLRNLMFVAADANITTYEIEAVGGEGGAIFKIGGTTYYTGSDMPEAPELEKYDFLGWYTTKDFQEGTEYTGSGDSSEYVVVFAKLALK